MTDIVKVIGKNIKQLREKNGYSRTMLANLSNTHLAWISKIEAGERSNGKAIAPSVLVISRISKALKVKPEDLLKTTGKPEAISDVEILNEIKELLKNQNASNKQLLVQVARRILK